MSRKVLSVCVALSLSAAIGGTFAAPSYALPAPTSQITPVAFQCGCLGDGRLWNWTGVPGVNGNTLASSAFVFLNGAIAPGTSPSEAVLANGDTVVAFEGANNDLWTWEGSPGTVGTGASTGFSMAPFTSPSITIAPNGLALVAFQGNNHDLWTWEGVPDTKGSGDSTGLKMASASSPSEASDGGLQIAVAFQASDGLLWTWSGLPDTSGFGATNTGHAMVASPSMIPFDSTSPSTNTQGGIFNVAFQSNNGLLSEWVGDMGTKGFAANVVPALGMAPFTSPSITNELSDQTNSAIAFQANDGLLWTFIPGPGGVSTGLAMASFTSPSITALASGGTAVAFQANTGALWTWNGNAGTLGFGASTVCVPGDTCADGGLAMGDGTSPSIGFDIAPHGLSLTAKGNVLAELRKPRTLVLLVYSTPKPANRHTLPPLKLLGRVALGQHPADLSQIKWGLRVHGHRLGAGHYLAELEAQIGRTLTTGGPTVKFDVGNSGKLTIGAQTSPAR